MADGWEEIIIFTRNHKNVQVSRRLRMCHYSHVLCEYSHIVGAESFLRKPWQLGWDHLWIPFFYSPVFVSISCRETYLLVSHFALNTRWQQNEAASLSLKDAYAMSPPNARFRQVWFFFWYDNLLRDTDRSKREGLTGTQVALRSLWLWQTRQRQSLWCKMWYIKGLAIMKI